MVSHAKGRHVKGVNILSCLVHYDTVTLPVGYEIGFCRIYN
ncbi:MAG: hypothetical protein QMO91_01310 [Candidatus Tisiphia sp.]|nr:hypothetical protein [Candidatus Tisiphia sp.]